MTISPPQISIIDPGLGVASNFFTTVVNFLRAIYSIIADFFTDVELMGKLAASFAPVYKALAQTLWSPIGLCVTLVVTIACLKLILGWGNV